MTRCHECHGIDSHDPCCPEGDSGPPDDLSDAQIEEILSEMPRSGSWYDDAYPADEAA